MGRCDSDRTDYDGESMTGGNWKYVVGYCFSNKKTYEKQYEDLLITTFLFFIYH